MNTNTSNPQANNHCHPRGRFGPKGCRTGGHPAANFWKHFRQQSGSFPVNIKELDDAFEIQLYAAGLEKQNFKITTQDDVLTISYKPEEKDQKQDEYSHQEYRQPSLHRRFALNGKVMDGNISAAYLNGVLTVTMPKNPDTNKPADTITVV